VAGAGWLTASLSGWLNEWLSGWLTTWLSGWLTDYLTEWLTDWLSDWLAGAGWLTGWLTDRVTDWLTNWLSGWLPDWLGLTDWLSDWLADRVADCLTDLGWLTDWLPDWVADYLTDLGWLTDRVTGWLTDGAMRYELFWDITQRVVVIPYRRFGTPCLAHLGYLCPWRWHSYIVPRNRQGIVTIRHWTSQKSAGLIRFAAGASSDSLMLWFITKILTTLSQIYRHLHRQSRRTNSALQILNLTSRTKSTFVPTALKWCTRWHGTYMSFIKDCFIFKMPSVFTVQVTMWFYLRP
jgi:hypothetical protein